MSDGYVAFIVSILLIGVLTAVIGDLASQMGCTVGLKDTVTAVAFVALGTSIPGDATARVPKHAHGMTPSGAGLSSSD